jgi:NDP-sugar pyrophosphorylase family protein
MKTFAPVSFFKNTSPFESLFERSINVWEVLPRLEDFILNFKKTSIFSEYTEIKENVFIGRDVKIEDGAKISGKAIIGHNSYLGHASFFRSNVLIADNVNIGHAVEVKNSVILSNSAAAHLNYIGDSIIGSNVNVAGGAVCANFRFDKKNINVKYESEKIETNLQKFGCIIGDDSQIGVNSVLNPGTILGKKTIVFPLTSVKGVHSDNETIR